MQWDDMVGNEVGYNCAKRYDARGALDYVGTGRKW